MIFLAETQTDRAMGPLQSAACTYRIALGPRAGQKVLTVRAVCSFDAQPTHQRCANEQGTLPPRGKLLAAGAPSASGSDQATGAEPKPDLPTSLKQLLAAYLPDGYPPIELAAEIAGTSVRTLQRRLDESQVTYSDLIQQARFEAARKLLCDTDTKAIDIAYQVGCADPSHFPRAFRRSPGISPRESRRQYRPH